MLAQALLFGGCAANAAPKRYDQVFLDVFDTVTTVILYDTDEQRANARMDELHALLVEYHRLYDIYHAYEGVNNLYTVNENAGVAPVKVDERILDLVEYAKEMDALTGGRMNVAMGGVLAIWQSYRDAGLDDPDHAVLPPMEALQAAGEHTDIDAVVIDRAAGTLYLSDPETRLDVGAVAKGYAVEKAVEAMKAEGVSAMLLSVGGNVCSIGVRPDGSGWKVAVRDPYSDGNLCVTQVSGQSVVTSGTYERYYTVDGKRYHHIVDPETLMPSTRYDSVTVIAEESALADALTTGLFCMPIEEGLSLVGALPGVEALWVLQDGTERQSDGFAAYLAQ
ncbi:MAG: FAD:protein FMN transferase [Clostridiales bacterium]|nr:FAD:protein FMN transferase [Clostridiales bacterium]